MLETKKSQVFISYSWKDQDKATRIEAALKEDPILAGKISVWRDQNDAKPGDRIAAKILEGLSNTDYFVLLVSENSNASPWVQREISTAVDLADKKKLTPVPVLLSNVEVPFEFRGLLYIDARSSLTNALNKLLNFLRSQLATIASIEPREILRKSFDDKTLAWKSCQDKLREVQVNRLRFYLTETLTLSDVKVLWFDLFGRKMEDEVNVQNLPLSCIELLERSRREQIIFELIDVICRNYPHVSKSVP